jgi:hypothetical protein
MTISQVYQDDQAPAIALLICFISKYGDEGLYWDSQLIRNEIERDYGLILDDFQADKLNAAIEVLTSNLYETNWNVFETCNHLLANVPTDASIVSPLSIEELIKSLVEAHLIRHEPIEYHPDINLYAGKIFYDFGFSKPPDIFPSAIIPKCNDCNDKEKNNAIQELFNQYIEYVLSYVGKIELR